VARDDAISVIDQHRVGEAEARNRIGDLFDLLFRMCPRIARVGRERGRGDALELVVVDQVVVAAVFVVEPLIELAGLVIAFADLTAEPAQVKFRFGVRIVRLLETVERFALDQDAALQRVLIHLVKQQLVAGQLDRLALNGRVNKRLLELHDVGLVDRRLLARPSVWIWAVPLRPSTVLVTAVYRVVAHLPYSSIRTRHRLPFVNKTLFWVLDVQA